MVVRVSCKSSETFTWKALEGKVFLLLELSGKRKENI